MRHLFPPCGDEFLPTCGKHYFRLAGNDFLKGRRAVTVRSASQGEEKRKTYGDAFEGRRTQDPDLTEQARRPRGEPPFWKPAAKGGGTRIPSWALS